MVVFRCDSSYELGSGHVMRCLNLAHRLRQLSVESIFVCKAFKGALTAIIAENRFKVFEIGQQLTEDEDLQATQELIKNFKSVEAVVLDNYSLGLKWEAGFFGKTKLLVIDDLKRPHRCNFILDNNFILANDDKAYDKITPAGCKKLLGTQYALIRDEFIEAQKQLRLPRPSYKKALVFFGGGDPTGETLRFLRELETMKCYLEFNVIVAKGNLHFNEIKNRSWPSMMKLHFAPKHLAPLMLENDFYIGSGGTVTWERMYLGLPGFIITVADNQEGIAQSLKLGDQAFYLGRKEEVSYRNAVETVVRQIKDLSHMNKMALSNNQLVSPISDEVLKDTLLKAGSF